jgi:nitroreductase/dihydropteridine reductase
MGIIGSKTQVDYYNDTYHITDTFSNHLEWKDTVKRLNRRRYTSFLYEQVNVPERFGSQPYVIYVIYDTETKDAIQKEAYDQPYVTICNCIFVLCARTDFHLRTEFSISQWNESPSIRSYFSRLWKAPQSEQLLWATRQTYVALGFIIAACAEESIPCISVDAFHSESIASLLDLPSHLVPTAILTIGAPD